ncbi:hypothetical protein FF38_07644 [Lucilia cuprina]|uniref:Uncharacterized protein n=1 Tax=Lucilia cuprina TaxID=7375 RepID=A0A0L0BND0_LUCCU|nr:hypothetical protein FF38_07644 [Lucilia cuprina]
MVETGPLFLFEVDLFYIEITHRFQKARPQQQLITISSDQQQPRQELYTYLQQPPPINQASLTQQQVLHQNIVNTGNIQINANTTKNSEVPLIITDENAPSQPEPTMPITHVIKSLLKFLTQNSCQPLWK